MSFLLKTCTRGRLILNPLDGGIKRWVGRLGALLRSYVLFFSSELFGGSFIPAFEAWVYYKFVFTSFTFLAKSSRYRQSLIDIPRSALDEQHLGHSCSLGFDGARKIIPFGEGEYGKIWPGLVFYLPQLDGTLVSSARRDSTQFLRWKWSSPGDERQLLFVFSLQSLCKSFTDREKTKTHNHAAVSSDLAGKSERRS